MARDDGRTTEVGWRVHPRLSDNRRLLRTLCARTVIPAFNGRLLRAAWEAALAPWRVAYDEITI